MALGIISPQMFKLYNFSISPEKIDNLIKNSDYTRDELASLFKQYNLRGINGEPIFYNRRYTQHQIPSKEADTLVKDFIENIKNHRDEIFRSFGYEEFERIIIRTRRNTGLHIEERYDTIIEELNKRLENETFMKTITQILANYKYKDTYNLIKPRNSVVKNI